MLYEAPNVFGETEIFQEYVEEYDLHGLKDAELQGEKEWLGRTFYYYTTVFEDGVYTAMTDNTLISIRLNGEPIMIIPNLPFLVLVSNDS
ncbi:hypothetical protein H4R24_000859 [Coemansia sp. RSA 988]|nr:hypothetical protein H4R24_000859 [Coemansia sp. RSA 988]